MIRGTLRVFFFIALFTLLTLRPSVGEETEAFSHDFTNLEGWTNSGCEISDDALTLAQEDGAYTEECYVEIPIDPEDVTGKNLELDVTRYNLLTAGDMENLSASDIGMHTATGSAKTALGAGLWFTSARSSGNKPSFTTDSDGNTVAQIKKSGSLLQVFRVRAGADYRMRFNLDTTELGEKSGTDQLAYLNLAFYDADLTRLDFASPFDPTNITVLNKFANFRNYDSARGEVSESFLIRALDCDDHAVYNDGDGTFDGDIVFNYCEDGDGNALKTDPDESTSTDDGTVYDESDIVYASLEFAVNWSGDGYANLDNVVIEDLDQVEVRLLDADKNLIQSSHETEGFAVENSDEIRYLRIYLRTGRGDTGPQVSSIKATTGFAITVSAGQLKVSFDNPRLGFTGVIPPNQDWFVSNEVRSLCYDPLADDVAMNCWDMFVRNGITRLRQSLPTTLFTKSYSESGGYEFEFHDGSYANKISPAVYLSHLAEANAHGMTILLILNNALEGTYWWGETLYNPWNLDGSLNENFDPTPTDDSDNTDVSMQIMAAIAAFQAEEFSGDKTHTFSDGTTVTLPAVDSWQVFVETNIAEPEWINALSDEDHAEVMNAVASAVKEKLPDAAIQTSLNPNASQTPQTFDRDYLSRIFPMLDADVFTHFNFNNFADDEDVMAEDFLADIDDVLAVDALTGWQNKPLVVGADAYSAYVYDPNCNDEWERGFGETRHAKLVARSTLVALNLPAEEIYYYVPMIAEGWGGGNLSFDSCWRSYSTGASQLFERVGSTGPLGTNGAWGTADGADEPTEYQANASGLAWLTIANLLSDADPYESEITALGAAEDESYTSTLYQAGDGSMYLALWFTKKGHYGIDPMTYMSGYQDEGHTSTRWHAVTIHGLDVSGAELLSLAGEAAKTLTVTTDDSGRSVVYGAVFGDMPVLIKLNLATEEAEDLAIDSAATTDTASNDGTTASDESSEEALTSASILADADGDGDSDGDGTGDSVDLDDDNDGLPDAFDDTITADPYQIDPNTEIADTAAETSNASISLSGGCNGCSLGTGPAAYAVPLALWLSYLGLVLICRTKTPRPRFPSSSPIFSCRTIPSRAAVKNEKLPK